MGKITDVWKAVEGQRPATVPKPQWQQSYDGVKAAMKHIGLELTTTRQSFDDIAIPIDGRNFKQYGHRKVVVTRNNLTSKPIRIIDLLNGHSGLLTDVERRTIHQIVGAAKSAQQPKGVATKHNAESRAVNELDILLRASDFLRRQHLYEFRLADIAYCLVSVADAAQEVWIGDQVKHSVVGKDGQCKFNCDGTIMTVAGMISYLNAGLSLTCIGKTVDDKVDVVWFFHGPDDIKILSQFDSGQTFQPRLHLKITSFNKFTLAYNAKQHRFDVGKSADECKRLMERKLCAVQSGLKRTLEYLNEDESQIPGENHRLEHKAFVLIRTACARINVEVERVLKDAYGPVDFRVGGVARVQDKICGWHADMRKIGGHPYNPDDVDILQLTDVHQHQVYALPMRSETNGQVVSFFSETALMRLNLTCSAIWKEANKKYLYNLKNESGIRAYVDACIAASQTPTLSDREWYSNMLATHVHEFGSKKQIKARKLAAKTDASQASFRAAIDIDSESDV